jgi:hypothetical protein
MHRSLALALLALALATSACRRQQESAATASPPAAAAPPFRLRDLAAATALDARLAALTLEASRYLDLVGRGDAKGAQALLPRLDAAVAEADKALAAVTHPLDRKQADAAVAAARRFAATLASWGPTLAKDPKASPATVFQSRENLGRAVNQYRQARGFWKIEAPLAVGPAQDFAEAGRELERAETQALEVSQVAPRDEGHKLDAGSARMSARAAAARARDAAQRLDPDLREAATRWVDAEDRSVQALMALQAAPQAQQHELSLDYQAARADALAALADLARRQADKAP